AEHRVERDARIQQGAIRPLKFLLKIGGPFAVVHVVAEHDYERERELLSRFHHPLREIILALGSRPRIADDCEAQRVGAAGKRYRYGREQGCWDGKRKKDPPRHDIRGIAFGRMSRMT